MNKQKTIANVISLIGYAVLLWLIYTAFVRAREAALTTFDSPETRQSWDQWRDDVAMDEGPVARRVPRAAEPPAVVLMRDLFWTCVVCSWIVASMVYFFLVVVIRGMLSPQSALQPERPEQTDP